MSLLNFVDMSDTNTKNKNKNKILLIDSDFLDNNAKHPNLALMKISNYYKNKGFETELLKSYNQDYINYPNIFLTKVFEDTKINIPLDNIPNLQYGGTGFFFDKAPNLHEDIEHTMPDYNLYSDFVNDYKNSDKHQSKIKNFTDWSIGFMTRGCTRRCSFCVNKKYTKVHLHSPLEEFYDPSRKNIRLWDDNIFAYPKWESIFDKLNSTGRKFEFKQGIDIRYMTERKSDVLLRSNYFEKNFYFAFDDFAERNEIETNLKMFVTNFIKIHGVREKRFYALLYTLTAYKSQDEKDIWELMKRIQILFSYGTVPYVMRYKSWKESKFRDLYITFAGWTNNIKTIMKLSFMEFIETSNFSKEKRRKINEQLKLVKDKYPDFEKNVRFKIR